MKPRALMLGFMTVVSFSFLACGGGTSKPPSQSNPNEWTWVGGADVPNQSGTYGTLGVAAPSNMPGARQWAVSWTDRSGNFWLFGGFGFDSAGNWTELNDLWKSSDGQWTWMSGSNLGNQPGVYGTLGTPAKGNTPGARSQAAGWTDASGNLWLFGGGRNDLWRYSAGEWTWMGGSNVAYQPGVYGTKGTPAAGNVPGPRRGAVSWTAADGSFWLFGGLGSPAGGGSWGPLNDLWKYSGGEWTWVGGASNVVWFTPGTYGTQGTAAPDNYPGTRTGAAVWTDVSGDVWMFGGFGTDSTGNGAGELNDLWKYSGGEWTWMGGSNMIDQPGVYGTQGTAAVGNIPGARDSAVSWTDASGNFWLFGGYGLDSTSNFSDLNNNYLNDLWKYSAGEWTWMGGSNVANQPGVYGTQGTPAASNVPGGRSAAVSWTDASGNLWLFGGLDSELDPATPVNTHMLNDLWKYEP